ncbi:cytochrome-c peroxidase [Flavobacterium salilacus subsp. salilacus]|uniref:cytochrome-c peroxidase n=1 Tax=Flavobacterium TaxID=237 RepID=UPI001074A946|nr:MULTISPECIES: cytochrome c peroxidase [Flavobacterium]KAF2519551.1 cytochrome-c peroxidase [Flavobacterium salilacus subsp. salilacus]MBE1614551.1 cytochrome-c peroxidase [Flavobacterium sp. SaA2.13]
MRKTTIAAFVAVTLVSCSKDNDYEAVTDTKMEFRVPANFPVPVQDISQNYPTQEGFELGRKLFYDARLSANNTISCSFCHEQASAFTHHGHTFSHGIYDQEGTRNAPSVQNMAFQSEYFYDGASNSIEMLSIVPIHNPKEMDETLERIAEKLKQDADYVQQFNKAFDGSGVTSGNILKALGQFMTMMISANSRYDKYVRNEPGGAMTQQELQGLTTFQQKCASCHATDLFTDNSFRNNGLPPNPNLNDLGRETVTGFAADRYKFKVPSLRNVALTKPYMHDGRFGSLQSVLNFYTSGMIYTETIDPLLHNSGAVGIPLSEEEKQALIAFLNTLTDEEFINNPLFYYKT